VVYAAARGEGIIIEEREDARLAALRISPLREGPGRERAAGGSPETSM
jgi:hypothetical protein